jgi:hypothetical protein
VIAPLECERENRGSAEWQSRIVPVNETPQLPRVRAGSGAREFSAFSRQINLCLKFSVRRRRNVAQVCQMLSRLALHPPRSEREKERDRTRRFTFSWSALSRWRRTEFLKPNVDSRQC